MCIYSGVYYGGHIWVSADALALVQSADDDGDRAPRVVAGLLLLAFQAVDDGHRMYFHNTGRPRGEPLVKHRRLQLVCNEAKQNGEGGHTDVDHPLIAVTNGIIFSTGQVT